MSQFVHLHTHSHYSLCDAAVTLESLVEKAHKLKMPALAITDHGNLFGAIEFYNQARKKGIKPIIGCELYISKTDHSERFIPKGEKNYHHLIVLARTIEGYYNLVKLLSIAYTKGFYYKPRVDKKTLKEHSKGLIALSACLGGEIPYLILKGEEQQALKIIRDYQNLFGKEYFFLELQNHGIEKQLVVNETLIALSKKHHIPLVATNDVHYLNQEDSEAHDILLRIGRQKKITDDIGDAYDGGQFYFKSYDEMKSVFADIPEALDNTLLIADMCNVELDYKVSLPDFEVPTGYQLNSYLRHICEEGLKNRYPEITSQIKDRLDYELDVICKMGYAGYFLIVWDFIQYAKSQNIVVGPGRGSAAGSLVAYTSGITNLDPLKYHLIFERFLNPERISMPDIDTDFQDEKRDQVIDYVFDKYGQEKVAGIITFGALKARGVIRDVGRVLDIPLREVDRLAKLIPGGPGVTLDQAYSEVPDLKESVDNNTTYQKLFSLAKKLEGLKRHAGSHAAGIVIGQQNLSNVVPLYSDQKTKSISTQYEGKYLEECGLIKMDFLGLKNLSVIQKCLELIESTKGEKINIENIPLDNKNAYKILQKGDSLGLFQLESSGIRELMSKLKPTTFEDIIALIALYRPGPLNSGMVDQFIKRKRRPKTIRYDHPLLENILKETYGVIVYQEQVMEIARAVGGFSMGKADELRKAMGKKDVSKMNSLKEAFVSGAVKKEIDKSLAETLYDQMAKFAEYGFNKSHSAAYALITYQTTYLKANYPIEYMSALLSCDKYNTDKIVEYRSECKKMKINILPPCVNKSYTDFIVESHDIRFCLSAIKNVGTTAVQSIIEYRQREGDFKSLSDFCEKVDLRVVNKKVLECLIKAGACDCLGSNRASLLSQIDRALEYAQSVKAEKESGQFSLFGEKEDSSLKSVIDVSSTKEWDKKLRLTYEKEVLGFYLSGHPLEKYQKKIDNLKINYISTLKEMNEGDQVNIFGLVQIAQFKVSKKGNEYASILLEGLTGSCEVFFFKKPLQKAKSLLVIDNILYIKGKVDSVEPSVKIIAESAKLLDDVSENVVISLNSETTKTKPIDIKPKALPIQKVNIQIKKDFIQKNTYLEQLKHFFLDHRGKSSIYLHFPPDDESMNRSVTVKAGEEFNIHITQELLNEIKHFDCVEKAWLK